MVTSIMPVTKNGDDKVASLLNLSEFIFIVKQCYANGFSRGYQ